MKLFNKYVINIKVILFLLVIGLLIDSMNFRRLPKKSLKRKRDGGHMQPVRLSGPSPQIVGDTTTILSNEFEGGINNNTPITNFNTKLGQVRSEFNKHIFAIKNLHQIAHDIAYRVFESASTGDQNSKEGRLVAMKQRVDEATNTRIVWGCYKVDDGDDITENDKKIAVIAFRGTEDGKNVRTDLNAIPEKASKQDGLKDLRIHQGFKLAHRSLMQSTTGTVCKNKQDCKFYEMINEFLEQQDIAHIVITGHSLGGALAVTEAFRLLKYNVSISKKIDLITFGSPRVGNPKFAQYINEHQRIIVNLRYIFGHDIVTHVPPKTPIHNIFYEHAGTYIQIKVGNIKTIKEGDQDKLILGSNGYIVGDYNADNQAVSKSTEALAFIAKYGMQAAIKLGNALVEQVRKGVIIITKLTIDTVEYTMNVIQSGIKFTIDGIEYTINRATDLANAVIDYVDYGAQVVINTTSEIANNAVEGVSNSASSTAAGIKNYIGGWLLNMTNGCYGGFKRKYRKNGTIQKIKKFTGKLAVTSCLYLLVHIMSHMQYKYLNQEQYLEPLLDFIRDNQSSFSNKYFEKKTLTIAQITQPNPDLKDRK